MLLVFYTTGSYAVKDDKGNIVEVKTLDRNYRQEDCKTKQVWMADEYEELKGDLGGNVQMVYELEDSPIILLVNTKKGFFVYATAIKQDDAQEYLSSLPASTLRNLTALYGMKKYPATVSKPEIIKEFLKQVWDIDVVKDRR